MKRTLLAVVILAFVWSAMLCAKPTTLSIASFALAAAPAPAESAKKYIDIGANPVSRTMFFDPASECVLRTDREYEVTVSDKAGKKTTGWLHKGEALVVDKATIKAKRVQFCSNPVHTDFVPSGTLDGACRPAPAVAPPPPPPPPPPVNVTVSVPPASPTRVENRQNVEVVVGGAGDKVTSERVSPPISADTGRTGNASGTTVINDQRVRVTIPDTVIKKKELPPDPPKDTKKVGKKGKFWKVLAIIGTAGAIAAIAILKSNHSSPAPAVHFPPPPVLPPGGGPR